MWIKKRRCCWNVNVRVSLISQYNYVLEISYDGSQYYGSQYQPNKRTVESDLKKHLIYFFKDIENLIFAGRTDAGVHAIGQYVNFTSTYKLDINSVMLHINKHSKYIKIIKFFIDNKQFHARKSALKREYIYLFSTEQVPVYLSNYISYMERPVDKVVIQECLNMTIGKHDFLVFQKTGSNVLTTIREIYHAKIDEFQYKVLTDSNKSIMLNKITIQGNAFLYRMVRNIIGAIYMIASGKNNLSQDEFKELLLQKKRIFNFKPAPSSGLYLNKIWY